MRRKQEVVVAGIIVDRTSETPVYRQIYEAFRGAILDGRLHAGERLPATRELATALSVSRSTAVLAFEHLLVEGYIIGRQGAGTYVNDELPDRVVLSGGDLAETSSQVVAPRVTRTFPGHDLPRFLDRERDGLGIYRPFRPGVPDVAQFPHALWTKLLASATDLKPGEFGYTSAAGYQPLRESIAKYVRTSRGVNCQSNQVIITTGAQQALNMLIRVLLIPGDKVIIEDPGYPDAWQVFEANGITLNSVALDEEGLCVDQLGNDARLIYVTPSHQYPMGVTMSLKRRIALLNFAAENDLWILEDDYDSEYRYSGFPLSSLQGIDKNNAVIYIGTFSKVAFPGLRLGYVIVPPELREAVIAAKMLIDRNCPITSQYAMWRFIEEGHFARHLRKMRTLYDSRRQFFHHLVETELSTHFELETTETGLHTVAFLRQSDDDQLVSKLLRDKGVVAPSLSSYTRDVKVRPGLVLGYAAYTEAQIRQAVFKIRTALR